MSDAAELWRIYDEIEARLTAPVSERMLDLAALAPGMRVLDVACGRGEPGIRAAHRVGPGGYVLGIDADAGVLELARARAEREGLGNLELRAMDAESAELPAHAFEVATSRWALMYLRDPIRALERVREALVPGGKLIAALWAEPARVPWATLGREVLSRHLEVPPRDPDGPGVFRFADPARTERAWGEAGFRIEHVEELDVPVIEAVDAAGIAAWVRAFLGGPLRARLAALPVEQQRAFEAEVAREAERYRKGAIFQLGGITRIVVARLDA